MAGYAKGPFAVDWEDRYDFATLRKQRVASAQAADAQGKREWFAGLEG